MATKKKSKKKKKIKKKPKKTKKKVKKPVKAREPQQITLSKLPSYEPPKLPVARIVPQPRFSAQAEKPSTSFAVLSYIVQLFNLLLFGTGAVISIIIYFIANKRFTRFHALQATFIGIIISLLSYVLKDGLSNGTALVDPSQYPTLYPLFAIAIIVALIALALKADKCEWFELPFFGGLSMRFI